MHVLLIDSNPGSHEQWKARVKALGADVTSVTTQEELAKALEQPRFSLGIMRVAKADEKSKLDFSLQQLADHCHWSAVVSDPGQLHTVDAYEAGIGDYWTDNCDDAAIASRLKHSSHLAELEERLAQAQKLESIGELAAGIAHEINTPIQYVGDNTRFVQNACDDLNKVLGYCQKLIAAVDTDGDFGAATTELRSAMDEADVEYLAEEIPSAIGQTLEGVDRVANIVRAMKDFAHPGVSEMTITDLGNAIENTVMVARNEWKYVANLETEFDEQLPGVPCLLGELNQVMLNMIVNAAHAIGASLGATPESKGTIKISTHLCAPYAEIRIRDSGQGVAPENIERIFKPFFTTKPPGKGTGQGLAIAHSVIVEKHRGQIDVESELGRGTCFTIRIPLEVAADAEAETEAETPTQVDDIVQAEIDYESVPMLKIV